MNEYTDEKQEYQHTFPQVWPDGTEFTVYTTPDNKRAILKHSSGSHIEFKNDGTVAIKAVKDLHIHSSFKSTAVGDGNQGSTKSFWTSDSDLSIEVKGKLSIRCNELDIQAHETAKIHTPGDLITDANNTIAKSKEQQSIEATKSVYMSTGEFRESVVTRTSEIGTELGGNVGGQGTMKVNGHFVIENQDPKGGITIKSAGYTNILTAAERIDLTGDPGVAMGVFDPTPYGRATYTHIVKPYPGPTPRGVPGSVYLSNGPGPYTEDHYSLKSTRVKGQRLVSVLGGLDELKVTGVKTTTTTALTEFKANPFRVTATMIFLN